VVINLELPWNPSRLEQRIGRVDRIGQHRTVHVFHLIAAGIEETAMLRRLQDRVERARRDIDVADPLASEWPSHTMEPSNSRQPQLGDEAASECVRLTRAQLARPKSSRQQANAAHPCLLATRRPSLRRWLRHRALCVVQTTMEDDVGRQICAHLSAFLVEGPPGCRWTPDEVARNLVLFPWDDVARINASLTSWKGMATLLLMNFWAVRRRRETAISTLFAGPVAPHQRGLFDARADMARAEAEQFINMQRADSATRVSAAASAEIGSFGQARLALVLAAQ
jgi:hypothetical protein